jgi:Bacterial alpha-2-macroglobulin MG3 domain/Bacterial Alpha-2-macroglobulin MG5 domain
MRRMAMIIVFILFATVSTKAEPDLPDIVAAALKYRNSLESAAKDTNVASLLADINRAQRDRDLSRVVALYEKLAGLEPNAYRAWLKLGLSWKEVDKSAVNGLSASWNAYRAAPSTADQVETLLLMTSILRAQLAATSESYQASNQRLTDIDANLVDMVGSANCSSKSSGESGDSTSGIGLLCANREQASSDVHRDTERLGVIAHDLDQLYGELASKVSGLDVKTLQASDQREKEFEPASTGNGGPDFSYKFANGITHSCVEFTEDLNPNADVYRDMVSVEAAQPTSGVEKEQPDDQSAAEPPAPDSIRAAPKWSLSVDGPRLCFDNLGAGLTYNVVLKQGLPSKLGATLREDYKKDLDVPSYPSNIRFAGGRFILPRSGKGAIEVHATNLKSLKLELFRVSDRTLYQQIALGFIGDAKQGADVLSRDAYHDLRDTSGELLWSGELAMPLRWKPNESVSAQIQARDLLKTRKEWLEGLLSGEHRPAGNRLTSAKRSLSLPTDEDAGLSGRFFADSSEFEAATHELDSPGVYALVAQPADQSNCALETQKTDKAADDDDSSSVAETQACDRAVQWFVTTDIGITFYEGVDNFDVVLRSLTNGEAVRGKVQLVTSGNRVLGQVETNEFGVATFARSLTRGTQSNSLAAIMAQTNGDFAFLIFSAERLDLSKLNVDGRTLPLGLDAFLTTDRSIYEPGQSVEVLALLRNRDGRAIDPPINATVRLLARDRILDSRTPQPGDWKLGGAHVRLTLPSDVRPGPARIVFSLGDEGSEIGETTVHVGPIVPDRVEVQFPNAKAAWTARAAARKLEIDGPISVRYLFAPESGPLKQFGPARGLHVEAAAHISAGATPKEACYSRYVFGQYDEKPIPTTSQTFRTSTDADGRAELKLSDLDLPSMTKPAAATIDVTVFDESGPLGSKSLSLPVEDGKGWIGVAQAPRLRQDPVTGKSSLDLDIVRLAPDYSHDGESTLDISLARERESYSATMDNNGEPQYTRVTSVDDPPEYHRELYTADLTRSTGVKASEESCVGSDEFENIFTNIESGRYVLTVRDTNTNRQASLRVEIGAAQTDPDELEPNLFVLSSNKQVYQPGEPVVLTAQTQFDGPILLALAQGNVERWIEGRSKNHVAELQFAAPPEWAGKGIYALATVFRASESGAKRVFGPAREIGANFFQIAGSSPEFVTHATVVWPDKSRPYLGPNDALKFRFCVGESVGDDCDSSVGSATGNGGDIYAAAFVVDEGLLGLTGDNSFRADPQTHFFGRRRLDVRVMDTYSRLLPATGGDRPGRLVLSNYTSDRIVSFAMGPIKLENGRHEFTVEKPELSNGKLSIRIVLWSRDFVSSQTLYAPVISRVVVDLGAPKLLLAGDHALIPLRVLNLGFAHNGDFAVHASSSGAPARIGFVSGGGEPLKELRFPLETGASQTAFVSVETDPSSRGELTLSISVDPLGSTVPLPGNSRDWKFYVGAPELSSVRTLSFPLTNVKTSISSLVASYVADYDPGTVRITARFADSALSLLNSASSFIPPADSSLALDRVTTSAIAFFSDQPRAENPDSRAEGERLIGSILSLQVPSYSGSALQNGSFLPYRTLSDPNLHEFGVDDKGTQENAGTLAGLERIGKVLDVFSLAESAGYKIPETSMADAREFARKTLATRQELGCSLEGLHATLALVDSGDADDVPVDNVLACVNKNEESPTNLSLDQRAALLAIAARFGRSEVVQVMLANFKGASAQSDDKDLSLEDRLKKIGGSENGQLRLAMIANFLARAGANQSDRETVATALLDSSRGRISPAAAAWFARDSRPAPTSALDLTSLRLDGGGLGSIHKASDGVLETETVKFDQLMGSPTAVSVPPGAKARGFVSIEGVLSNDKLEYGLPAGAVRRRIFDITDVKAVKEIEAKNNVLDVKVGDLLAIILEGDKKQLAKVYGGDPSQPYLDEPIVLADLLPSALKVTLGTALCRRDVSLPSSVAALQAVGDLRTVESNPDRWMALVVPDSRHVSAPSESASDGQPSTDDQAAQPPEAKPGAADCIARPTTAGDIDFRQAYVARVNLAGRFIWPGVSIEASTKLTDTYHGDKLTLNVSAAGILSK